MIEGAVVLHDLGGARQHREVRRGRAQALVRADCLTIELTVEITDDGIGGADASSGTGLRGLADRLESIDGSLEVVSPAGGGTRLVARIPVPTAVATPA